jgi:shikimate kinase
VGCIVVLLGPPGSGKSTIGAELGRRGLRWREWEQELLQRWGSLEAFAANKEEALAEFRERVLAIADADPAPLLFESTGLSDADFLDRIRRERPDTLIVRLDVPEEEAIRRVSARPGGHHLSDEVARNREVWRAFTRYVVQGRRVDLALNTSQIGIDSAAAEILELLRLPQSDAGLSSS